MGTAPRKLDPVLPAAIGASAEPLFDSRSPPSQLGGPIGKSKEEQLRLPRQNLGIHFQNQGQHHGQSSPDSSRNLLSLPAITSPTQQQMAQKTGGFIFGNQYFQNSLPSG